MVPDGLRTRRRGDVREAGLEVLDQLLIWLLRIGPAAHVRIRYKAPETLSSSRPQPRRRWARRGRWATATLCTYLLRNIAGKLQAEENGVQEHRKREE
jgi:hypothetical protein